MSTPTPPNSSLPMTRANTLIAIGGLLIGAFVLGSTLYNGAAKGVLDWIIIAAAALAVVVSLHQLTRGRQVIQAQRQAAQAAELDVSYAGLAPEGIVARLREEQPGLVADLQRMIGAKQRIKAIKTIRTVTGCDLLTGKQAMELLAAQM